jgi:hypothetical protein
MQEKDLDNWPEFLNELEQLERDRESRKSQSQTHVPELLYRGQSDACWRLETTLERTQKREVKDGDYLRWIKIIRPEIQAFTNKEWPDDNFVRELQKFRDVPCPPPGYEYMAYLRHYGFPSPMIDWTASPFVAAYLAFREEKPKVKRVAIYAFTGIETSGCVQEPSIRLLGPTINTHRRHFLQQSHYTICVKRIENNEMVYCSHEAAFEKDEPTQCRLWKFTLPATERKTVLTHLHKLNITGFSLFGSEESLMETLAIREFVIRE